MMADFLNQPLDVDKLASTFADLLKTPIVVYGKLTTDDENVLNIYSEWTVDDVTKKERTVIAKNYTVLKNSLTGENPPVVYASSPSPTNKKLISFSNSGLRKAIVVNGAAATSSDSGTPAEFLQIFNQDTLEKTYDLKVIDKHGGIYSSGTGFGATMIWNYDETKLMYLAEKKLPTPKPFFTSYGSSSSADADTKKDANGNEGKGEEFAFKQSWGETLSNCHDAVIVILDIETDAFTVIELPDKAFPSDLQWRDNASVIGVAYTHSQYRLGLIYCSNRNSRIFKINTNGTNFKYLNGPEEASMSPRVRPDGEYLIWQEREALGPHDKSRKIIGLQLVEPAEPSTIYDHNPANEIPVYRDFPTQCWTPDGSKFFVVTPNETEPVLLAFSTTDNGSYGDIKIMRCVSGVLSIGKNYILGFTSSTGAPPKMILIDHELNKTFSITASKSVVPFPLKYLNIAGAASPNSFYYGPSSALIKPKSLPLLAIIHGGPHSILLDEYSVEIATFLNLGFGVLFVNFIGSIGGKRDVTASLLGKIGEADVMDCEDILQKLLAQENTIDQYRVVIYGGSHSGFLGAHLSARFPDSYKATTLRNPVIDVLQLTGVSDITDWAFVETALAMDKNVTPVIRSLDCAKKLMDCSPIHNVETVKAATLLLLGSEDLRVPMSQGLAYYRALKAANKVTEVRVYPDTHSLRKVPVRFDVFIHTLIWYYRHLKIVHK